MNSRLPSRLEESPHPARFWEPDGGRPGGVICGLCPRHCRIPGQGLGFCGVRKNAGGEMVSLGYGKMLQPTVETIETDAVFHFAPGERILSLGNIGCMLRCDFCQNWKTSQARLADDKDIRLYSPVEIVDYADRHGIRMLSWTYNDPVVWQEFVMDTARLARKRGIRNLYKSAFYISPEAVEELIEVIDVFSLSLKSMDPEYYARFTGGRLQPVLDGIKQVYKSGRHLEISNLLVTGRNDNLVDAAKVAQWMLDNTGAEVPLHYVRFHPDFKYTHVDRTSIPFIRQACGQARKMGMKHVYMGNVFEGGPELDTRCECGAVVVGRMGLAVKMKLDPEGRCPECRRASPIRLLPPRAEADAAGAPAGPNPYGRFMDHVWAPDMNSIHIENRDGGAVVCQALDWTGRPLNGFCVSHSERFMVSRSRPEERSTRIYYKDLAPKVLALMDRANYPVA